MKNKNNKIVILVILIILVVVINLYFFSSMPDVSNSKVDYDNELIGQFLLNEWVNVMIDVRDFSNITIHENDSIEVETMKDNLRWNFYRNTSEVVLSTLSEDEFKLERKSDFGVFFSGNITKEGFEKLLKDERVLSINIKKGGHTTK